MQNSSNPSEGKNYWFYIEDFGIKNCERIRNSEEVSDNILT